MAAISMLILSFRTAKHWASSYITMIGSELKLLPALSTQVARNLEQLAK